MMALYSILFGIAGSLLGIFPVSLGAHLVFLNKVNTTVYGTGGFIIGNDTAFLVCLGILTALVVSYHERIINLGRVVFDKSYINEEESGLLKELGLCLAFYAPTVLLNIFFENSGFNNVLLSIFVCLNTVVIYSSDYIEKTKFNGKNAIFIPAIGTFIGGLTGLSEISVIFISCLMSGKKPNKAIRFALLVYVPIIFIKTVIYLIKACVDGFLLNFGYSLLVFATSLITAFFAISILKKTAIKRNFRLFAYYTAIFAVIVIYTFIKG